MIKFDTIGSDPEFFIEKDGEILPSFMFLNGTKSEPEDYKNGFALLKDNLLVEGNIPPATEKEEFIGNMELLKSLIQDILEAKGAKLLSDDVQEYKEEYIFTEDGMEFGCSNYLNPYKQEIVATPQLTTNKRVAGFHIHIGYTILDENYSKRYIDQLLAKAFDYFVTIPSDKVYYSKYRRKNYGDYGSFRPTIYGLEFRSLGSYFTQEKYLGWIYDQVLKTIEFVSNPDNHTLLLNLDKAEENNYEVLNINLEDQLPITKKEFA